MCWLVPDEMVPTARVGREEIAGPRPDALTSSFSSSSFRFSVRSHGYWRSTDQRSRRRSAFWSRARKAFDAFDDPAGRGRGDLAEVTYKLDVDVVALEVAGAEHVDDIKRQARRPLDLDHLTSEGVRYGVTVGRC